MFIAMNRFKVKKGSEQDFEQVWLTRKSHLVRYHNHRHPFFS